MNFRQTVVETLYMTLILLKLVEKIKKKLNGHNYHSDI